MWSLLLVTAFFTALVYFVAAKKGASKKYWLTMAILFGPFALPFVFFSKKTTANCA